MPNSYWTSRRGQLNLYISVLTLSFLRGAVAADGPALDGDISASYNDEAGQTTCSKQPAIRLTEVNSRCSIYAKSRRVFHKTDK